MNGKWRNKVKSSLFCLLFILILPVIANADIFRCPNGALVSTGDSISEAYIKCDPPSFKNVRTETEGGYKGATIVINVEEWTYNEGPNKFVHMLVFRNGVLAEVRSLGYGK